MSGNRDLPQVPVQIARCGGADVLCDDGRGWRERTADRRPRSDKGFETAHVKEPIFEAASSRSKELFTAAIGTTRDSSLRSGFVHGKTLCWGPLFYA